eukprot:145264-Chlamydomonas_euryale.AAC.1
MQGRHMTDALQGAVQGAMQGTMQGAHAPMHAPVMSAAAEGTLGRALLQAVHSGGAAAGYMAAKDQCLLSNVTYKDRHIDTDNMTWCTVGTRKL